MNAFYAPNAGRRNLTVLTGAFVERIEFEKTGKGIVAIGDRYAAEEKGHFAKVKVDGEVILCAGMVLGWCRVLKFRNFPG